MRGRALLPVLAVATLVAVSPAAAQDHVFKVFATANWISPLSEDDITFGSVTDSIQAADDVGYEAGFEWRLHKIVGLEGSYMVASQDVEFGDDPVASVDSGTLTAALNFHLIPTKYVDFWVAPIISWVDWDDIKFDTALGLPDAEVDSEVAYGAAVGFDFGFGKLFAITTQVRWLSLDISSDDEAVGVDPLIARAGIAFRFGNR